MIEFGSAWALVLLALPPLVLWLAARASRPRERTTGTLEVWREVGTTHAVERERRRRIPWALWLLAAALTFAVLAMSDPRRARGVVGGTSRVVLDRSQSMYLPSGDATRLQTALDLASDLLAGRDAEWVAAGGEFVLAEKGTRCPPEWLVAPRAPWPEPRWELFDAPGTLWLTDKTPEFPPTFASVITSGGAAVPGVVADLPDGRIVWNGVELARSMPDQRVVRTISIDPRLRKSPIGRAASIWAKARAFVETEAPNEATLQLNVDTSATAVVRSVECVREAWSMRCEVADFADLPREPWRSVLSVDGRDVVRARAGALDFALISCAEPRGDPAAFAVFWAEIFDSTALAPNGISVAERSEAGPPFRRIGAAPPDAGTGPRLHGAAVCALLAAVLAAFALTVRR